MGSIATVLAASDVAQGLLDQLLDDRDALMLRARELVAPRGGRAWVRVADTPDADAWLIAWGRSSHVGSHDHGGSHGAVHVLRGVLVESYRDADEANGTNVRRLTRDARVSIPPDRVHDVANAAWRPALSLHVYAPRLTAMTFYEAGDAR